MEDLPEIVAPDFPGERTVDEEALVRYLEVEALGLDQATLAVLCKRGIRCVGDLLELSPGILLFKHNFSTDQVALVQKRLEDLEAAVLPTRWDFWRTRRVIDRAEHEIWARESFPYNLPYIEQSVWNRFVHRALTGKHYKKPRYRRRL